MGELDEAPLNDRELMRKLGLKKSQFYEHKKRGAFRALEVKRPIGYRRYARALVERHLAGESITRFGQRM